MTTLIQTRAEREPETVPASGAETARSTGRACGIIALRGERWWLRAMLALLFALYVRAVGFAPVYDDNIISPWSGGWRDVPKFFTHDIFGSNTGAQSVYYRPLAALWGFLLTTFAGSAPGFQHLSAILVHLTVVVLAYVFGRHLFGDERLAMLTAALFGLHPSKVESVAWIGSSDVDGLGAVFFFASLIMFLKWQEKLREGSEQRFASLWWAASVALFAGAMFTKETMLCVPILIAAWLWLNSPKTAPPVSRLVRALRSWVPYGAVWAIYMAIRHQVIRPAGPSADYIHPTFTLGNLWTAPYAVWWYLRHLAMPWGLSVEYTPVVIDHPTLRDFFLPAAGLVGLALAAFWLWRRQRSAVAAFLGFWFVLTLAPPVIVSPMVSEHERYLYISSYAFCALVAWAVLYLGKFPDKARLALVLCLVALLSGLTWHETGFWDNEKTLWGRVLQISPSNLKAHMNIALLYEETGDRTRALAMLDEGLRYYPNSPSLWFVRGGILAGDKQMEEARECFLKVLQVTEPAPGQPAQSAPGVHSRAAAAYRLSLMANTAGHYTEAERYVRTALSLNYQGVGYHSALSESLRGEGRIDEAKSENALELRLRMEQQRANGLVPLP